MECSYIYNIFDHDATGRLYSAKQVLYKAVLTDENNIIFSRGNEQKKIKITEGDSEYIYKIQKRRIIAEGGAAGLMKLFNNKNNTSFFISVINKVFDYMNGGTM